MCDPSWSAEDLARVLCGRLVADGKLRSSPSFIREDREAKLGTLFSSLGLGGERMLSFASARELEVLIRGATEGQSWVDDVQHGLGTLLTDSAASAAPVVALSEEAAAATAAVQQRRSLQDAGAGGAEAISAPAGASNAVASPPPQPRPQPAVPAVIVVDFTHLSGGSIHNKFDKTAVNDPDAKRDLGRTIEANFDTYCLDESLLASGAVRHADDATWKAEVQALRDAVPGHFWAPVFRP
jgi:hypothetical protein